MSLIPVLNHTFLSLVILLLNNYTINFESNAAFSQIETEFRRLQCRKSFVTIIFFQTWSSPSNFPTNPFLQILFLTLFLSLSGVTHPFSCKSCLILSLSQATLLIFHLLNHITQVWFCLPPLFLISCKILFMSVKFYLVSLASHCLGLSELFGS